jgi:hypothetical protein
LETSLHEERIANREINVTPRAIQLLTMTYLHVANRNGCTCGAPEYARDLI